MNVDARVEALEAENERLRDDLEQLERVLGLDVETIMRLPVEWRLTRSEARVLSFLSGREAAGKEAIMVALYSDRPNEVPEPKIVDVFVCKLRKKLSPFGVEIETLWGQGYRLAPTSRDQVTTLLRPEAA